MAVDKRIAQFDRIAEFDVRSMIASESIRRSGSGGIGSTRHDEHGGAGWSKRERIIG